MRHRSAFLTRQSATSRKLLLSACCDDSPRFRAASGASGVHRSLSQPKRELKVEAPAPSPRRRPRDVWALPAAINFMAGPGQLRFHCRQKFRAAHRKAPAPVPDRPLQDFQSQQIFPIPVSNQSSASFGKITATVGQRCGYFGGHNGRPGRRRPARSEAFHAADVLSGGRIQRHCDLRGIDWYAGAHGGLTFVGVEIIRPVLGSLHL